MNLKKLIENNSISFNKIMLQNYRELSLDEVDAVMLMQMHQLVKETGHFQEKDLVKLMSISEKEITKRLANLMKKNLIDYLNQNYISFDNLYSALSQIVSSDSKEKSRSQEIVEYLQITLNRPLLAKDLEFVNDWVADGIDLGEIKQAALIALANNKTSLAYIDKIIINHHPQSEAELDPETKKMIRSIHVK